jgi:hypothetical protein
MLLLLVLWQTTELLNIVYLVQGDKNILLLGVQAGLLPALYLAPAFIKLVFSLFGKWEHTSRLHKFFWYLPAIIMSFFVFTSYNVREVVVLDNRFFYIAGSIYWIFAAYFILLMSYGLYILVKNRKTAGPIVRRQISYIFIATAMASISGLVFSILFPILGMQNFYYLGVNSTIFFTILITYALFRYRFFDLHISLYQAFINLFKLLITGFIYYILYVLFYDLIKVNFNNVHSIVFLLLVFGLTAPVLFKGVNKLLLNLFVIILV